MLEGQKFVLESLSNILERKSMPTGKDEHALLVMKWDLPQRLLHLIDPVRTLEHFAWFRTIGCADNSIPLHQVD